MAGRVQHPGDSPIAVRGSNPGAPEGRPLRIAVRTFGCSHNHADSEQMIRHLQDEGHVLVDAADAEVILYNTCTVKNPTQDRILAYLRNERKPVVVAGCMVQADTQGLLSRYVRIGTEQLHQVERAVLAARDGTPFVATKTGTPAVPPHSTFRTSPHVAIIPISTGCLSTCTFCKTRHARGRLRSRRPGAIEDDVQRAVADGAREIWLTSQDNGAYGKDIGSDPARLLHRVTAIPGSFLVRFGMANPQWVRRHLDALLDAYAQPKMYRFLHLPAQSGSDAVLRHMRRGHTAQDVRTIVHRFRERFPDITLATDIICGYPTETEEDFQETLALVRELRFSAVHISKFYPRPGTDAATLPRQPTRIAKERSRRLTTLFTGEPFASQHDALCGRTVRALFTTQHGSCALGRTENYTQVIVHSDGDISGTWQDVHVQETTRDDLRGTLQLSHGFEPRDTILNGRVG